MDGGADGALSREGVEDGVAEARGACSPLADVLGVGGDGLQVESEVMGGGQAVEQRSAQGLAPTFIILHRSTTSILHAMWFSELEQGLQKYAGYTPRPLAFSPPPSPLLRPRPLDAPPLPHLPPEILHIILRFAGGPAGIASNWRFEILRACALVARAWRGPSQAELFRHVKLNKLECAVRLLQTAEQANGKALVQCTVSLELGYELLNSRSSSGLRLDKVDTAQLTRSLLLICPNIRHLCIRGTNVALTDLSIASSECR